METLSYAGSVARSLLMEDAASFPISDEGQWQRYSVVSKYLGLESGLFDFEVLEHFTQSLVDSECMSSMEGFSGANESVPQFRKR